MNEIEKTLAQQLEDILEILTKPILKLSDSSISLSSLIISVIIVLASFRVAKLLGHVIRRYLEAKSVDSGVRDSIGKFAHYFVIAIGILFALDNLGISINSLAAVGAVLMVGIGFGLQNITQNFISGIIILIERPVKVGDIVNVGSTSGRIVDIRVRSTIIQTRDEISIIVPNSKLISEEVINESLSGERVRQHVRVGVAYGTDVPLVNRLLIQAAIEHERVMKEPAPIAIFENFGDSSLDFDLRFWCEDLWVIDQINSEIRSRIDELFREHKVSIPFPQRDVHLFNH